jgi:hypothetical protein
MVRFARDCNDETHVYGHDEREAKRAQKNDNTRQCKGEYTLM